MSLFEERGDEINQLPASPELAHEEGFRFVKINGEFRQSITTATIRPSEYALNMVDKHRIATSKSAAPIGKSLFFRDSGDEELVKSTVGAVLYAIGQNWKLAKKINSGSPSPGSLPEGLKDMLVTKMTEEEKDTELPANDLMIDLDDLETLSKLPADALAYLICNIHEHSVEDLYRNFMTSNRIVGHEIKQAELEKRRERRFTIGLAAVGSFIASSLAYVIIAQRHGK